MTAIYNYKAFGLNIQSELYAPDWLCENPSFQGESDLYIKLAPIKSIISHFDGNLATYKRIETIDNKLLLTLWNGTRYLLWDNTIVVEPVLGADTKLLQSELFSSVMNIILQKRDSLAVHGCGIAHNDGVYVFVGNCGIGKSSLALTFVRQGYTVTSDDLCAIKTNATSAAVIYPSYPHVKLSPSTAAKLNIDISALNIIHPQVDKYFFPLKDKWCSRPLPIKHICILDAWEKTGFSLERLHGVTKVVKLRQHMHSCDSLRSEQLHKRYFYQTKELMDNTPISIIKRPKDGFLLYELVEFIQKKLMEN